MEVMKGSTEGNTTRASVGVRKIGIVLFESPGEKAGNSYAHEDEKERKGLL